ncbi:MAG TPA: hypothetical protein PLF73_10545, partial [Luteimonas sp.]|nr:hypothetical protein [Luteimonas sp.]
TALIAAGLVSRILAVSTAGQSRAEAPGSNEMSKGLNQKKEQKKKPAKTMKEKKAEKRDKKASKPFSPT